MIEIEDSDDEEVDQEMGHVSASPPSPLVMKQKSPTGPSSKKSGETTGSGHHHHHHHHGKAKEKDKKRGLKIGKSSKRKIDSSSPTHKDASPDGTSKLSSKSGKKRGRPPKDKLRGEYSMATSHQSIPSSAPEEQYEAPPQKKFLSVLEGAPKPVVVVQNWSKEGLLQELGSHEKQNAQGILNAMLHYSSRKPTDDGSDLSSQTITMSMTQLQELAAALAKGQAKSLRDAVDASFYRCAAYVDDVRGDRKFATNVFAGRNGPFIAPGTAVPTFPESLEGNITNVAASVGFGQQGGAAMSATMREPNDAEAKISFEAQQHIIKHQQEEMVKLRKTIADLMEEKKRTTETFKKEQAYLKDQVSRSKTIHARSVRAFMKASVTSLRWLREKVDVSDDEDDGDGDGGGGGDGDEFDAPIA